MSYRTMADEGQADHLEPVPGKTDESITKAQELSIALRDLMASPGYPQRTALPRALAEAVDFLLERYIVEG